MKYSTDYLNVTKEVRNQINLEIESKLRLILLLKKFSIKSADDLCFEIVSSISISEDLYKIICHTYKKEI